MARSLVDPSGTSLALRRKLAGSTEIVLSVNNQTGDPFDAPLGVRLGDGTANASLVFKGQASGTGASIKLARDTTNIWEFGLDDSSPSGVDGFYLYSYGSSSYVLSASSTGLAISKATVVTSSGDTPLSLTSGTTGVYQKWSDSSGVTGYLGSTAANPFIVTDASSNVLMSATPTSIHFQRSVHLRGNTPFTQASNFPYIGGTLSSTIYQSNGGYQYSSAAVYYDGTSWKHAVANSAGMNIQLLQGAAGTITAFKITSTKSYSHSADSAATLTDIFTITHDGYAAIIQSSTTASTNGLYVSRTGATSGTDVKIAEFQNAGSGNYARLQIMNDVTNNRIKYNLLYSSFAPTHYFTVNNNAIAEFAGGEVNFFKPTIIQDSGQALDLIAANDTSTTYMRVHTSASTGQGYFGVEGSAGGTLSTGTTAYYTVVAASASGTGVEIAVPGSVAARLTASTITLSKTTNINADLSVARTQSTTIGLSAPGNFYALYAFRESDVDKSYFIRFGSTYGTTALRNQVWLQTASDTFNIGNYSVSTTAWAQFNSSDVLFSKPLTISATQFYYQSFYSQGASRLANLMISASSGGYGSIGYNAIGTSTGGVYNFLITDRASRLEFYNGAMRFWGTATTGSAGNPITETLLAYCTSSGAWFKPGGGSWLDSSDERLKLQVKPYAGSSLDLFNQVEIKQYRRKDKKVKEIEVGVIAQQIGSIFPECVVQTEPSSEEKEYVNGDILAVHYPNTVFARFIHAFQEISTKLDALDDRITALEG